MRLLRSTAILCTILCALIACATLPSAHSQTAKDLADNRALDQRFIDAFQRLDVNAIMSCYANNPNLIVVFPDGTQVKGWADVRTGYTALFSMYSQIRGELTETNYVATTDGMVGFGKGYLYMTPRYGGSSEQRLDIRYTDYRIKRGATWAYTVDTMTAVAYQPLPTDSLYTRLGGYDVIALIADDFVQRMTSDPQLKPFFGGMSTDSRGRMRQLTVDLIASKAGGPVNFVGRDMRTTHAGLGVTDADWQRVLSDFGASVDKYKVPAPERRDLMTLVTTLKDQLVEK
ncbi:MAG TPA: hypothetical protein VGK19_19915 [Capsulimonadaceae bacterium]|jgi:hemoglobin